MNPSATLATSLKILPRGLVHAGFFLLILWGSSLPAQALQSGAFTYTDEGVSITITDYPDSAIGVVDIPASIAGKPVTRIGSGAFGGCGGLTSVTIPSSVGSIGDNAFNSCSGLTSLTIPSGVTSIGLGAFAYCSSLTGVIIPSGVTSIANNMFYECIRLTSVTIPSGVTSIGTAAFASCSGLTSVVIPSSLTSIADFTFYGCIDLRNVTIPSSVTSIGGSAFYDCNRLTSVTIPSSITSIGEFAFGYCSGLTSVTIPSSVTSIGSKAFIYCLGLASVTIPSSVTNIGDLAFNNCYGLTSVTILSGITSIDYGVFSGCYGLTSVTIPSTVTHIGNSAFSGCYGLVSVTIPSSVTSIDYSAFAYCSGLASVTIPPNVTTIGDFAFFDCSGLTGVTIPSRVASIGVAAFSGCNRLTSASFLGNAPTFGGGVFDNTAPGFQIRYNRGATGFDLPPWSDFINGNNEPPVADAKSATTLKNTAVALALSGSDPDGNALTYSIVTVPAKGTLIGIFPNLSYLPNTNATGSDSFTFRVNDGSLDSAPATVSISINEIPVVIGDVPDQSVASGLSTAAIPFTVGPVGASLTVRVSSSDQVLVPLANIFIDASGPIPTITVTAAPNESGVVTITLSVTDGNLTATDTFVLTVTPGKPQNFAVKLGAKSKALTDGKFFRQFGRVATSNKKAVFRTITITNTGKTTLRGLKITKDGVAASDFIVMGYSRKPLAPGKSITVMLLFRPKSTGDRQAALHISSSEALENPFDLTLAGTGFGKSR